MLIPKHAIQLIAAIRSAKGKRSPWEKKFLVSVQNQAKNDQCLTDAQSKVLQEIYRNSQNNRQYQNRGVV